MIIESLNMEPDPIIPMNDDIKKERLRNAPVSNALPSWHYVSKRNIPIGNMERVLAQDDLRREQDQCVCLKELPNVTRGIEVTPTENQYGGFPWRASPWKAGGLTTESQPQFKTFIDYP